MKDSLGDRMKSSYEDRTRIFLPRRSYTLFRIDGKAFHTYTKKLNKPFDKGLYEDMCNTTIELCKNIQGAIFGYTQSDEISILVTDFKDRNTDAWFDNNLQKMCSVSASIATASFNKLRILREISSKTYYVGENLIRTEDMISGDDLYDITMANFDSRVWQIPQKTEVMNYFIWRQQDATRNSISMMAQSLYSHKELQGKKTDELQELIFQKGHNWNDLPSGYKRGFFIEKVGCITENNIQDHQTGRNTWNVVECPVFTQDPEFLNSRIPNNI